MTNEERILERLEAIEERLSALQSRGENGRELMEQLTPIGNHAFLLMVKELEMLNGRVTLDDLFDLCRKGLLSVPKLTWLLDQLENFSDLWRILHPAIGPTFPHIVQGMGKWEQNGVFSKLSAMKDAGGTVLDSMTPEDILKMGEGLAFLTTLLQRMADPKLQSTLNTLLDLVTQMDVSNAKPTGLFGMLAALNSQEGKQAMGVAVEALKSAGSFAAKK